MATEFEIYVREDGSTKMATEWLPTKMAGRDGEIGLGVEAESADDDCEKAGNVARKLPVLPLPPLPRRQRSPLKEKAVGPLLVRCCPPARARGGAAAYMGAEGGAQAVPEHSCGGGQEFRRRHCWLFRPREREICGVYESTKRL
ncbi:hypothetical protein CsSME_00038690 [Camellia sinensis var. sinensis]